MNKTLKIVLNTLIVVASLILLICLFETISSYKYAHREVEDPAETYAGIFDYLLDNHAYGEVLEDYHFQMNQNFEGAPGYENLYRVGEYGHAAFMARVYDEKGDAVRASACRTQIQSVRGDLGDYAFTADQIDEMLEKAP